MIIPFASTKPTTPDPRLDTQPQMHKYNTELNLNHKDIVMILVLFLVFVLLTWHAFIEPSHTKILDPDTLVSKDGRVLHCEKTLDNNAMYCGVVDGK